MGTIQSKDQQRRERESKVHYFVNNNFPNLSILSPYPVRCDAPPPPPPPLPSLSPNEPPPPPSLDGKSDSNGSTNSSSSSNNSSNTNKDLVIPPTSSVPNPGPYEQAIYPYKSLLSLNTHDGFNMEIQKQLSPFMVVMHNFALGTSFPDGSNKSYTFITQVADENGVVMTNFDPFRKSVGGRIIKSMLGGMATTKLQASVSPDGSNDQLLAEVDIGAMTWTGNLKYGSMGGGIVFGMNYFQGITERLAMGGEGMYVAANGNLMNSYTIKYDMPAPVGPDEEGENDTLDSISKAAASASAPGDSLTSKSSSSFMAQLNPAQGMLNLYYKRVVTPNRVTLGAELMVVPTLETQLTFGGEFKLERSKVSLAVDGTGKIQSILETKIGMAPGSPTLSLNAEVDHGKDSMKFGYGLNVGS